MPGTFISGFFPVTDEGSFRPIRGNFEHALGHQRFEIASVCRVGIEKGLYSYLR